jgi:hypothetical protein
MIIILVIALASLLLTISNLSSILPKNQLVIWEKSNKTFSQPEALKYIDRLKTTLIQSSNNLLLQARLFESLAVNAKTKPQEEKYLSQARKYYFSAAQIKPTFALSWAKSAFIDDKLQSTDEKSILRLLYLAIELGPYEPKNQQVVIPLIYKYWNYIKTDKKIKKISLNILMHSIRYKINSKLVEDNANKYQLNLLNKLDTRYTDA